MRIYNVCTKKESGLVSRLADDFNLVKSLKSYSPIEYKQRQGEFLGQQ